MTSGALENGAFAVLGWLLGLFGQRIMDWARDLRTRSEIREALIVELNDLRARLALTAAYVRLRKGEQDAEFVSWLRPILLEYHGFYADQGYLETLEEAMKLSDEKAARIVKAAAADHDRTGLEVKQYYAPFLTEKLAHLTLFSPAFQQKAFEIHSHLGIMNEESEVAWFYFSKTFDATSAPRTCASSRLMRRLHTEISAGWRRTWPT